LLESFDKSVTKGSQEENYMVANDDESLTTLLPTGWALNQSLFHLTKKGNDWSTHHKRHTFHNQVVYPNFVSAIAGDIFGGGEHLWVNKAVKHANKLGYQRIDVRCSATIPSSQTGDQKNDIFWCHPSYHSYPYLHGSWHDWAMVQWHMDEDEETYKVEARLLMFAKLSEPQNNQLPPKVISVVHSLSQMDPDQDSLLTFASGDVLSETIHVVDAEDIAETAFVLPCIKNMEDEFPLQMKDAKYYLVMPPRSEWKNIGW
jgi:hypothetical protein